MISNRSVHRMLRGGMSVIKKNNLMCGVAIVAMALVAPNFGYAEELDPVNSLFQGFYIGSHIGFGGAEYSGIGRPGFPGTLHNNGYLTGLHAGYNWQAMSNFLWGIEGDLSLAPWGGSKAILPDRSVFVSGHLSGIASLRGRLGLTFDHALAYATAGVAFASTNATGQHTVQFSNRSKIAVGGVVGAGIEFMTSHNLAIRAEGLYYMFDQKKQVGDGSATGFAGLNDAWVARVGASWYFDRVSDFNAPAMNSAFQGFYKIGRASCRERV